MIAKAKWFSRRKYSGWGLTPKTWQGVVYILAVAGIVILLQSLPVNEMLKVVLSGIIGVFILIDFLQAMATLNLDEREQKIEAIAERNAAWTMVSATVFTMLYVVTIGKGLKGPELMPALIFPIFAGVIAKAITNFILERRGI